MRCAKIWLCCCVEFGVGPHVTPTARCFLARNGSETKDGATVQIGVCAQRTGPFPRERGQSCTNRFTITTPYVGPPGFLDVKGVGMFHMHF